MCRPDDGPPAVDEIAWWAVARANMFVGFEYRALVCTAQRGALPSAATSEGFLMLDPLS